MYFPNLDELSLRLVLALPKASRIEFDCNNTFLTLSISFWPSLLVTAAMYFMIIFEASVFPAPDSPLITIQVSLPCCCITLCEASAMAKMCGGFSKNSLPNKKKSDLVYILL